MKVIEIKNSCHFGCGWETTYAVEVTENYPDLDATWQWRKFGQCPDCVKRYHGYTMGTDVEVLHFDEEVLDLEVEFSLDFVNDALEGIIEDYEFGGYRVWGPRREGAEYPMLGDSEVQDLILSLYEGGLIPTS